EGAGHEVGTVTVDEDDALVALLDKAAGDVGHIVDEVLDLHRDRAGKPHVVRVETVGDDRHAHHEIGATLRGFIAEPGDDPVVEVNGQVRTVLLDGPDRDEHDAVGQRGTAGLRPGHGFE